MNSPTRRAFFPILVVAATTLFATVSFAADKAEASPATSAATLTWNDLVRRPEARPITCTVNKESRFQGGVTVRAGSTVNILEVKPNELVVGTTDGRTNFSVKPTDTNILAAANAAWSQLTPAQRELTYPALLQRTELWPYRLKLLLPFELEGRRTRVGDSALLLGIEGDQLFVRLEGTDLAINVQPQETDIMSQARAILEDPRGAAGRVLEEVAGKLVSPITGRPVTLDPDSRPKYVVMYMGAGWCGPCQAFAPELVKLLKAKSPKPSDVALLYLSGDRNSLEAKNYVTKLGIEWPTAVNFPPSRRCSATRSHSSSSLIDTARSSSIATRSGLRAPSRS